MSLPDDELNTFPWRNTFKKQQRVLIKRSSHFTVNYRLSANLAHFRQGEKQRVEEDVGDDCENGNIFVVAQVVACEHS